MKRIVLSLLGFLFFFSVSAQTEDSPKAAGLSDGYGFDLAYKTGRIFKHTPKFKPTVVFPSSTYEVFLFKQQSGRHEWETRYHYPRLGLIAQYTRLGNDTCFGRAFSLLPTAELNIAFHKKFRIKWRVGVGLAYITRPFNYVTNPRDNVIGSHLNNCTSISLSFQYHITQRLAVGFGGSFTHWSSGSVTVPNLGINIPSLDLRIRYEPKPVYEASAKGMYFSPVRKKIILATAVEIGFKEKYIPHGPMFHLYGLRIAAGKYLSNWNKLWIGMDGHYSTAEHYFNKAQEIRLDNIDYNAYAFSFFLRDEQEMGRVSINEQLGFTDIKFVANPNGSKGLSLSTYQRVTLEYTLWRFGMQKEHLLRAEIILHTHWFNAEYVAGGLCCEL